MSVGSRVTERSAPTDIVPPEAHPNSSEISVDRPLLPNEYLWTSRHGGPSDPSSFDVTDRNVSVQTWRFPDVVQLVAAEERRPVRGCVSGDGARGEEKSDRTPKDRESESTHLAPPTVATGRSARDRAPPGRQR